MGWGVWVGKDVALNISRSTALMSVCVTVYVNKHEHAQRSGAAAWEKDRRHQKSHVGNDADGKGAGTASDEASFFSPSRTFERA